MISTKNIVLFSIYILIGLYIIYKLFSTKKSTGKYEQEMEHILKSDEFKVKSRHE